MDVTFFLFLSIGLGFLLWLIRQLGKRTGFSKADKKFFHEKWRQLDTDHDLHHAVMEADKLLHLALEKKGYRGSMAEQLKSAGKLFSDLDNLWYAHKLRNRLAHELDFRVTTSEGQKTLGYFHRALKDLKVF